MDGVVLWAWAAVALWVVAAGGVAALRCPREPPLDVTRALRSPGDRGYRILVSGEPDYYVPDAVYTLSLLGSRTHGRLQMFSRFMLTAEPADPRLDASPQRVGTFQLFGDSFTAFNDECVNTVSEANDLPKTEVQAMWTAPARGSGCIIFRAMVLENVDNWWADDGALSHRLCELPEGPQEGVDTDEDFECCACDEAKYKLVFEGLWSNVTHPKDFPFSLWLTHFSDVIGASHERNFSFWGEGQIASDGVRMVAEWGSVRAMEQELRANASHLRTLIKAGGLWYPNVNSNTSTSFKVDRRRNLLSIISMLGPTPDWIVGVSGLNLCLRNCSWTENRVVDLYPYDAGTDNGISYMSPNSPTIPREKIRRITTMYPEDPRAPFYNPGGEMLPLARLYLTRESLTPRPCSSVAETADFAIEETDNAEDSSRPECAVTEYSDWSPCSVTCGKGLRMRSRTYRNPLKADMLGCGRQLLAKEMCVARDPSCPGDLDDDDLLALLGEPNEAVCATTDWGAWSECSVSCGTGERTRSRYFVDRMGFKKCPHVELRENIMCKESPCIGGFQAVQETEDPKCPLTEWSDWSPCSATCGRGLKLRTRLLLAAPENQEECSARLELVQTRPCQEQRDCHLDMATAKQVCMMEADPGPCRGYFERWYFEVRKGMCVPFGYGGCRGNRNNFMTQEECMQGCSIMLGGPLPPPLSLGLQSDEFQQPVNCVVSAWGNWSPCAATCGRASQIRTRTVLVDPKHGGKPCPKRLSRKRKCNIPACDE